FHAQPNPVTFALSLHDALPISSQGDREGLLRRRRRHGAGGNRPANGGLPPRACRAAVAAVAQIDSGGVEGVNLVVPDAGTGDLRDRKSTRLNSSHGSISYAVFC